MNLHANEPTRITRKTVATHLSKRSKWHQRRIAKNSSSIVQKKKATATLLFVHFVKPTGPKNNDMHFIWGTSFSWMDEASNLVSSLSSSLCGSFRSSWWGREADDRRRPYFGRFATVATGIRLCVCVCVSVCKSRRRMRKNCCFCLLVCGPGIAKPGFRVNSNVSSSGLMVSGHLYVCQHRVCMCAAPYLQDNTKWANQPSGSEKESGFSSWNEPGKITHTGTKRIQKAKWSTMRIVENKRSEIKCENDTTMVSG